VSTQPQPRPAPNAALQNFGLAVMGAVLALGGIVWATGQLAGRLASGKWPRITFGEIPPVLGRLPHHLSDPAAAWPKRVGRLLPGPFGLYATLVLILLVAGALAALVWGALHRSNGGGRAVPDTRGARWARAADLRDLLANAPRAGRITLGRFGNRLVLAEPHGSLLVFGPTQTGKTTGLAIPAILEWQGPVICTTVKSDLLRDTHEARAKRDGEVFIFDPTQATGRTSSTWSPLGQAKSWWGAQEVATALTSVAEVAGASTSDIRIWQGVAAKLLAPILHAAALGDRTMADVVRWIDTQDKHEPIEILASLESPFPLNALHATVNREAKARGGAYMTAEVALGAYQDPRVQETARSCEITPGVLLDGRQHTLYICAPSHDQARLRPLLVTLINQFTSACATREQRTGAPLDPPLLLVLDEAANIAPLPNLPALCSSAAVHGIQLVTVFQDLAQVRATYGHDQAKTIVSNHFAQVFLGASSDPDTLEHAARIIGEAQEEQTSMTVDSGGRSSTTRSTRTRQLLPPDGLRRLPRGTAVLLYRDLPATLVRLRPWYLAPRRRIGERSTTESHS
jgi:type IV secretion system protein VirD4